VSESIDFSTLASGLLAAGWELDSEYNDLIQWRWQSPNVDHWIDITTDQNRIDVMTCRGADDGDNFVEDVNISHPRWRPLIAWVLDYPVGTFNIGKSARENLNPFCGEGKFTVVNSKWDHKRFPHPPGYTPPDSEPARDDRMGGER